ncbi:MAG: hypothetical protein PHX49_09740 [Bacteroidales bacterium]|nr:hypothetical protein [Bacteroidales bacterium]
MSNKNKVVGYLLLAFLPFCAIAQNVTNSPYSRFGLGRLSDNSVGANRSMAGTGIGIRSCDTINGIVSISQINPLNPASYSDIELNNFLFDFGLSAEKSTLSDSRNKLTYNNGALDYIIMAFPLSSKLGFSGGLMPYSASGYNFRSSETIMQPNGLTTGITAQQDYIGSGGISQLYAGLGYSIKKDLSVGLNIKYLFGSVSNSRLVSFPESSSLYFINYENKIQVNDLKFDLGVQYTYRLNQRENLTFGAIFSPGKSMHSSTELNKSYGTGSTTDTTLTLTNTGSFDFPNTVGVGLSYNKDNKLTVAADFEYQMWSDARYYSKKDTLNIRARLSLGAEYVPSLLSRNILKSMHYRAGFSYEQSYINVNGNSVNAYRATVGIGIPYRSSGSMINLGFEYSLIPSTSVTRVQEKGYKVTLGILFSELWFKKRVFK